MRIPRFVVTAALCLLAWNASAAEPNPALDACSGKAKGDACSFEAPAKAVGGGMESGTQNGTCQDDKCCELDYSKGSPPTSNCTTCLACKADGSAPPVKSDSGAPADSGPNQESPRTGDDPPASGGNGKRGCTLGSDASGWALLLLVPVLATRSRRER